MCFWNLIVFWILFFYQIWPCALELHMENKAIYKGRICKHAAGMIFREVCSGSVTRNTLIKYKDKHIREGTPYTLFVSKTYPLFLLIVLDIIPKARCSMASFDKDSVFQCSSPSDFATIQFYQLYCFNRSLSYGREFGKSCNPKADSNYYKRNAYTIILYTRNYLNTSNRQAKSNILTIIIFILLPYCY